MAAVAVACTLAIGASTGTALAHDGESNHKESGKAGTGIEININSNGTALVRGAQVTNVSGSEISANTSFGSSVLGWIIKTDSSTGFSANKGAESGLANIAVGDTISFQGVVDQTVSNLTVKAKHVKEWTQSSEAKKPYNGIVTAINATLGSFTIKKGDATSTVETNASTTITKNGEPASFADIMLNAKVKIAGALNASSTATVASAIDIVSTGADTLFGLPFNPHIKAGGWLKFWHR